MAVFWVVALVNFYQITRRYNPEDSHLHTRRCENHKSYLIFIETFYRPNIIDTQSFTAPSGSVLQLSSALYSLIVIWDDLQYIWLCVKSKKK
jgi:hypothetical protein